MSTTEELVKKIEQLSLDKQEQVKRYIKFLLTEVEKERVLKNKEIKSQDNGR
jgi:predicted transcriptional regulator